MTAKESKKLAPALFVPHGGGPMPLLNDPSHAGLNAFLTSEARQLIEQSNPKAIVVVTAHWEEAQPTISSGQHHDLLFDYYGFPPEAYKIKFPAPGEPSVAQKIFKLLQEAGLNPKLDEKRGWDHGVFVPMKLLTPNNNIPIVQLSVLASQNAEQHLKVGKALEPLRAEGVAIVGSGMSFHNMRAFRSQWGGGSSSSPANEDFDKALEEACTHSSPEERKNKLAEWEKFPGSHDSHPAGAAEHLMPLFVVAGAGGDTKGKRVLSWDMWNTFRLAAYLWE